MMGEEIGAAQFFRVGDFYDHKEDLIGQRTGDGRFLFRFYQDLNRLARRHPALRSKLLDVLHAQRQPGGGVPSDRRHGADAGGGDVRESAI
jgi:hypothetical protein